VDGIMGVLLAFAGFVCLYEPDARLKPWLAGAALAVLALTKGAGFPFALMGCVIFFFASAAQAPANRPVRSFAQRLVPLCLTFLAQVLWKLHLSIHDIGTKWVSEEAVVPALWDLLLGRGPAWRTQVIRSYGSELASNTGYGLLPMSYVGCILLLGLACVLIVILAPREKRRVCGWCCFGLLGAVVIYAVSLLYSYLFLFKPEEALMLASVSRYLGTPATALLAVVTACLLTAQPSTKTAHRLMLPAAAVLLCLQILLPGALKVGPELAEAPLLAAQTQHKRYLCQNAAATIRTVSDGSDVYVISPRDNGAAVSGIAYELAPAALPEQHSGIGCMLPEELYGGYNVRCSPQEWSDILYNGPFRYVYLYQVDGYFVTGYRSLFENEDALVNGSLLEILRQEDGSVLLRAVP
jgi:hypothetical protein